MLLRIFDGQWPASAKLPLALLHIFHLLCSIIMQAQILRISTTWKPMNTGWHLAF